MKRYKLYFNKTKEIDWLNEMARKGWNLKRFDFGLYTFEHCKPGEYVYDCDLKDKGLSLSEEYRSIMESQGMEIIPSGNLWFFVRRRACDGPLELYTDDPSRIDQYKRIRNLFKGTAIFILLGIILQMGILAAEPGNPAEDWPMILVMMICILIETVMAVAIIGNMTQINVQIERLKGETDPATRTIGTRAKICLLLGTGLMMAGLLLDGHVDPSLVCLLKGAGCGLDFVFLIMLAFRRRMAD